MLPVWSPEENGRLLTAALRLRLVWLPPWSPANFFCNGRLSQFLVAWVLHAISALW